MAGRRDPNSALQRIQYDRDRCRGDDPGGGDITANCQHFYAGRRSIPQRHAIGEVEIVSRSDRCRITTLHHKEQNRACAGRHHATQFPEVFLTSKGNAVGELRDAVVASQEMTILHFHIDRRRFCRCHQDIDPGTFRSVSDLSFQRCCGGNAGYAPCSNRFLRQPVRPVGVDADHRGTVQAVTLDNFQRPGQFARLVGRQADPAPRAYWRHTQHSPGIRTVHSRHFTAIERDIRQESLVSAQQSGLTQRGLKFHDAGA